MGDYTTQTMYQNEKRTVELTIRDDYNAWEPDSGSAEIKNYTGTLLASGSILTSLNKVYCDVPLSVTENVGEYYILWRLNKNDDIFRHRTDLLIEDLENA